MKASEFVNLMRKVIREEVRTIIKEELKDLRKPIIRENAKPTAQTQPAAIPQVKQKQIKRSIQPPTFEGPLAGLLSETYEAMIAQPHEEDEWPDMNGGQPMTSQMFAGMEAGDVSMTSLMNDESPLPDLGGGYGDPTSAFIKDYSSVMKAADTIQGKR